jgi:hypothetical protein
MALDPSIALGVRPIEIQNPLNQFAQAQQIQAFQRQNELANRAIEQEEGLNRAYARSLGATGEIDPAMLRQNIIGANLGSKLPAVEKTLLETSKLRNEVGQSDFKLRIDKANKAVKDIASFTSRDEILADLKRNRDAGNLDPAKADQIAASIPQDPAKIPAWQLQTLRGILDAKDLLEQQYTSQDFGGGTRVIVTPKFAGGGPAAVVPGSQIAKTATIADQLAREKFNWEKANPGFELKETENGDIVGVNKRTLQAFPVTMGGAAPAVAPMGGSPRIPATTAPAITQVIPGMTSVLDQRAPVAPVTPPTPQAGTPLKGKGTALTESQGNATAFGMRMLESNKLLNDLEKSGIVSGGRIKSAVEGTINALVPYQGEKLAAGVGNVMNVLPGVLGGPSESQQQYQQAKTNFITAVLRKESGAVIGPSEFETEEKKYFPQAGDSKANIAQKQRARELAVEAMKIQAGPGAKSIGGAAGVSSGNVPSGNDPLGLLGR